MMKSNREVSVRMGAGATILPNDDVEVRSLRVRSATNVLKWAGGIATLLPPLNPIGPTAVISV